MVQASWSTLVMKSWYSERDCTVIQKYKESKDVNPSTLVHRPREVWCQVVERSGKLQVSCTWEPLGGETLWCFTWPWDIKYGFTWLEVLKEGSNRGVDKQNHGWVLFSNDNFPTHLARDSGSLIFIRLMTINGPASSKFLSSQTWWLS